MDEQSIAISVFCNSNVNHCFPSMKNLILYILLLATVSLHAQNPLRFEKEVNDLVAGDSTINRNDIILFTGSSSIRLWKDLPAYFPEYNVVSRGFGGSEMSDLLYYADKLIFPYRPKMIFIYEGDNDIKNGKSPDQVLQTADSLLSAIRKQLPAARVVFISAKPSVARWQMKGTYEEYNRKLKAWVKNQENVEFADVWTPMLDRVGNVRQDLFVEDNLHMNKTGYTIWAKVMRKYFRESK